MERGSDEERARSTTLFIGNLPYTFEDRDLAGLLERFGRIRQISVPWDRVTRRNRGFAFVEFEQRLDAEDAFYKYNGYSIDGRALRLDWDVGMERKLRSRGDDLRPSRPDRDRRDGRENHRDYERDRGRETRQRSPERPFERVSPVHHR